MALYKDLYFRYGNVAELSVILSMDATGNFRAAVYDCLIDTVSEKESRMDQIKAAELLEKARAAVAAFEQVVSVKDATGLESRETPWLAQDVEPNRTFPPQCKGGYAHSVLTVIRENRLAAVVWDDEFPNQLFEVLQSELLDLCFSATSDSKPKACGGPIW